MIYFDLTNKQIDDVKKQWSKKFKLHSDGCLCGYYECKVKDNMYVTIDISCRKSSYCPAGMDWIVHDDVNVYNMSVEYIGFPPTNEYIEETLPNEKLKLLGQVNKNQAKELKEIVRKSIIRDYSSNGYRDEYGNDIRFQELLKFEDVIENIYDSITKNFDLSDVISNIEDINKFKIAIKNGLNK